MPWMPSEDNRSKPFYGMPGPIIRIDTEPWQRDSSATGYLVRELQTGEIYTHEQVEFLIEKIQEGYRHIPPEEIEEHNQAAEEYRQREREKDYAPAPPREPRPAYVYLIGDGECVKIGVSTEPEKRLRSLQTANRSDLTLLHKHKTKSARDLEAALHSFFDESHTSGEWFALNKSDIAQATRIMDRWGPA